MRGPQEAVTAKQRGRATRDRAAVPWPLGHTCTHELISRLGRPVAAEGAGWSGLEAQVAMPAVEIEKETRGKGLTSPFAHFATRLSNVLLLR
jgi:hypothetical protein